MPTTTFADVKLTEEIEHTYENETHEFSKGDVVRMPRHTAGKFVHNWDKAEWTGTETYEVDDKEYDDVVMTVKESGSDKNHGKIPDDVPEMKLEEMSYEMLQQVAKEHDVKANQSQDELLEQLKNELYEKEE